MKPVAWRKGWLKLFWSPFTDSEVIVSAHLTDRVLKLPNTSIIPARPKCIGFHPNAMLIANYAYKLIWNKCLRLIFYVWYHYHIAGAALAGWVPDSLYWLCYSYITRDTDKVSESINTNKERGVTSYQYNECLGLQVSNYFGFVAIKFCSCFDCYWFLKEYNFVVHSIS